MGPQELLIVLITSVAPFIEVRGSVPLAYVMEPSDGGARAILLVAALAGNLVIAPAIVPLLGRLEELLMRRKGSPVIGAVARLYDWAVGGVRRRIPDYVRSYGSLGLALFVAVPIPGSGAWSGALIAHLLGLKGVKTIIAIEAGVITAFALLVAAMEGIISVIPH